MELVEAIAICRSISPEKLSDFELTDLQNIQRWISNRYDTGYPSDPGSEEFIIAFAANLRARRCCRTMGGSLGGNLPREEHSTE